MINLVDLYATVAELLGEELPAPRLAAADGVIAAPDSVSFLRLLRDPGAPGPRASMILHSAKGVFAIRQGPWKYIEGKPFGEVPPAQLKNNPEFRAQLYNLARDPGETNNVLEQFPEEAERLAALLEQQRTQAASR